MFTLILPYMEQNNVYQLLKVNVDFFNPVNMPPANPAYSTVIKNFLCPSADMLSTLRRVRWEEKLRGVRLRSAHHPNLLAQVIDLVSRSG